MEEPEGSWEQGPGSECCGKGRKEAREGPCRRPRCLDTPRPGAKGGSRGRPTGGREVQGWVPGGAMGAGGLGRGGARKCSR